MNYLFNDQSVTNQSSYLEYLDFPLLFVYI